MRKNGVLPANGLGEDSGAVANRFVSTDGPGAARVGAH